MMTEREREIEQLCDAAGIHIEATAVSPKSVIATIRPLSVSWPTAYKRLVAAMEQQQTASYSIKPIGMPGKAVRSLRFEALPS